PRPHPGAPHPRPAGPGGRVGPGRGRAAAAGGRSRRSARRHLHGQLADRLQGRRPCHRRVVRLRGGRPGGGGGPGGPGRRPGGDAVAVAGGHGRPPGPVRRPGPARGGGRHRAGRVRAGPPPGLPGAAGRRRPADRGRRGGQVPGRAGQDRRPAQHPPRLLDRPGPGPPGRRGAGHGRGDLAPGQRPPARGASTPRAHRPGGARPGPCRSGPCAPPPGHVRPDPPRCAPPGPAPPAAGEPARVEAWRLVLVGVAAAVTMLLHVLVGHAAGPSPLRTVNLGVQGLHMLAVGPWIGGLVWLLAGLRGRERPEQVASAARFSRLAAPVLGLVAITGLSRALHPAGGWRGLLDSSYGRFLDLKVALFLALVALGALNRFRIVPALAGGVRRFGDRRRNVRGEVVLAACILLVTAVFSQLPPGKFVVEQTSAKPPAPPAVQVEGTDFATSVRINLTVAPGTPGPNTFTAKVTDYDSGESWPATRVALRLTPRAQPDIGATTLDLTKDGEGLWRGQGNQLSIAGSWTVLGLVEGSGAAVTVPMELAPRQAPQQVKVSEVPGQPPLYAITLAGGETLQGYIDPGRPGPNTVHFTFFNSSGDEQPSSKARATMTRGSGPPEDLTLTRLGEGHFAANIDLEPGRVAFAIDATAGRAQRSGRFEQAIR